MSNVIPLNIKQQILSRHQQECLKVWTILRSGKGEAIHCAAEIMKLIHPDDFMLVLQAIAGDYGDDAYQILEDLTIEAIENLAAKRMKEKAQ